MTVRRSSSKFKLLPQDIRTEIISCLAKYSRSSICNLLAAVPTLGRAAAIPVVFKNLNIHDLTLCPIASVDRFHDVMHHCLANGNVQAHYIRGIVEHFETNNIDIGLNHLRIAAEGSYDNAIYLYGMIKLCTGETAIARAMIDSLGWRENKARADNCWKRIKRSLHGVRVTQLEVYTATYWTTRATIACHRDNIQERCDTCFYYKQIIKFVYVI